MTYSLLTCPKDLPRWMHSLDHPPHFHMNIYLVVLQRFSLSWRRNCIDQNLSGVLFSQRQRSSFIFHCQRGIIYSSSICFHCSRKSGCIVCLATHAALIFQSFLFYLICILFLQVNRIFLLFIKLKSGDIVWWDKCQDVQQNWIFTLNDEA